MAYRPSTHIYKSCWQPPAMTVKQGQIIGLSGSSGWTTGPHLHLGVYIDGETVDPLAFLMTEDA